MATKFAAKKVPGYIDGLSEALYEDSNIKGLDHELLRLNRKLSEGDAFNAPTGASDAEEGDAGIQPKKFKTKQALQIYGLLMEGDKLALKSKRHLFSGSRMIFEFDIAHDFFSGRFSDIIPTTIFHSVEDGEDSSERFCVNLGGNESLFRRLASSFETFQKSGRKKSARLHADYSSAAKGKKKLEDASKFQKSDSEDIFADIGAYVFRPLSELSYRQKKPAARLEEPAKAETVGDREINSKAAKEDERAPKRRHRHERESQRHSKSGRDKPSRHAGGRKRGDEKDREGVRKRREGKGEGDRDGARYFRRQSAGKRRGGNEHAPRRRPADGDDASAFSERGSSPKALVIRTEPMPARELADQAMRNLAPRHKTDIYKRIEEEMQEEEEYTGQESALPAMGFQRALKEISDPYDINPVVEFGTADNEESDDEELQERSRKMRKFAQKQPSRTGLRNMAKVKLDNQWKKIQQKLNAA